MIFQQENNYGNSVIITTQNDFDNNGIGVYVHWNGGYDSVSAFLKYCDNGVYIIEKWKIIGRRYTYGKNEQMNYDLCDMVCAINKAQPRKDRLDKQIIKQMLKGENNNADN